MTVDKQESAEVIVTTGYDLLTRSEVDKCFELADRAVVTYPEDAEIRLLRALCLTSMRPEEAPWEIATAVSFDSDNATLVVRAARLMFDLGEYEPAKNYARHAKDLVGQDLVLALGLLNLGGKLAAVDGDFDLAEESLRAVVGEQPFDAEYVSDLAQFLVERGRHREALAIIECALEAPSPSDRLTALRDRVAHVRRSP